MKLLLCVPVLLLVLTGASFEKANKTSRASENLSGAVLSVKEIGFVAEDRSGVLVKGERGRSGPSGRDTYQVFDRKGNQVEYRLYDQQDSLVEKTVSRYDRKGRLLEAIRSYPDGTLFSKTFYLYDKAGRLLEVNTEAPQNRLHSSRLLYQYDEVGNLWVKDPAGATLNTVSTTHHADGGEQTVVEYFDADSLLSSRRIMNYNARGILTEEIGYSSDGDSLQRSYIRTYEPRGLMTRNEEFSFGEPYAIYTYTYDERGNRTGEMRVFPDGRVSYRKENKYVFDKAGNWIECTSYVDGRPVYMLVREIKYR